MYFHHLITKPKWNVPLLFLVLLLPLLSYNGLIFHTLIESFAIIIAILAFVVVYSTYPFSQSHHLMFVGCGYFWVGILDFCHTVSFSTLAPLIDVSSGATIQFWIAARFLEAGVLLFLPSFIFKKVNRYSLFLFFAAVFSILLYLILNEFLPVMYIKGEGLTQVKIISEYAIIGILIIAAWRIFSQRENFSSSVTKLLLVSIAFTIAAELSFTLYSNFSSFTLILGHIFKLLSFWIIYTALVENTLTQPFKAMSLSSNTFNSLPDAIVVIDKEGVILQANNSAKTFKKNDVIGSSVHQFFHNENQLVEECSICQSIASGSPIKYQEVKSAAGWSEITLSIISHNSGENVVLHVSRDINLRKTALNSYKTTNRLYTVLRLTNQASINNKNKKDLLNSICEISVRHGSFSLAWIGMIKDNNITPTYSAGTTKKYLNNIKVKLTNSVLANGPVGMAASQKSVFYVNNTETDPTFIPWRDEALKYKFKSLAATPIIQNGHCIGVFALYSTIVDAFDTQTLELLSILSDDISSMITYIDSEEQKSKSEAKLLQLSRAINQTKSAILISDVSGIIEYVNPYHYELTGYSSEEILNANIQNFRDKCSEIEKIDACWQQVITGKSWRGEIGYIHKQGDIFWAMQSASPIVDKNNHITHIVWTLEDNTNLHNAHETISQLAYYDSLTNLPNRRLFQDRFQQAINLATRQKKQIALFYFDLDNFKSINDSFGHEFGDLLLKYVADILSDKVRTMDTVTRLGGDEFSIIINDVTNKKDVMKLANKILHALNQKTILDGRELTISSSIGISFYPGDGETISELMKSADMAMYHAKDKGKNNYQFYEEFLNINAQQQITMARKIQTAIDDKQFKLYYQPQIDTATGKLSGVEALIRWFDHELGMIPPDKFIPIAEESSLIIAIGEWVIDEACHEFKQLLDNGFPKIKVAINISASQFQHPLSLKASINQALTSSQLPNQLLQLELTESVLVEDMEQTLIAIQELKEQGVTFAIDDFGTGYSSLSYLKTFPADIIKIDRSFVQDIETDQNDRAIISAITKMAHELGPKVLAEGVETEQQLNFLKELNCDYIQGYYYAKPMPANELLAFYLANDKFH